MQKNWITQLNRNEKKLRIVLFLISCLPSVFLVFNFFNDNLGINVFTTLSHTTGHLGLIFILFTLAITPLRRFLQSIAKAFATSKGKRLSDWNFLIKMRRQLGLFGFFYCFIHFNIYLFFDIDWNWQYFQDDWKERAFIILGLINLSLLFLLAITSPNYIRKKLGRWWRRLHWSMYPIAILSTLHYFYAAKIGDNWAIISITICTLLLSYRALIYLNNRYSDHKDDGMIAHRTDLSKT